MTADPVIQLAELEMDSIDHLPDCSECREWKAAPDDTLCVYCRREHPRADSGLDNIPFGANVRENHVPVTRLAGNAEVVRATSAPSPRGQPS